MRAQKKTSSAVFIVTAYYSIGSWAGFLTPHTKSQSTGRVGDGPLGAYVAHL